MIDDHTNFANIYLLEFKSEKPDYIKHYINERWKMLKFVKIRCDNGREYLNKKLTRFYIERRFKIDLKLHGKEERLKIM